MTARWPFSNRNCGRRGPQNANTDLTEENAEETKDENVNNNDENDKNSEQETTDTQVEQSENKEENNGLPCGFFPERLH